jgi:Type IV pilus assembly protein PilM
MAKWLGLDISARAVRVAVLRSSYRKIVVEAVHEERIADHEAPSAAVRAAMQGIKADAVAAAVPGQRAFTRILSLPVAAQRELSNVLGFEVESTLPVELDDAVMDHRILTIIPSLDDEGQLPILTAVAYTDDVRDRIGLVRRGTGLEPQRVGVGALPYCNLALVCPELAGPEPIAIFDLDDEHADFMIMIGGEPRFLRSLSRGVSGLPADAGAIARELRQTVAAWRMQGGAPVKALYVVGQGRATPGLDGFMQAQLGMTVAELPKLEIEGIDEQMQYSLPRFAKAISLALSLSRRANDLNLRQGDLEAQQNFSFLRDKTPLLSGLGAAIFVSFFFSVVAEQQALDREQASLEARLEATTEAHFGTETADPKEAGQLLDDAISGKTGDPMPKVDGFDVIVELSERIPDDIVHDIADFEFNRDTVQMKGIVPQISDANLVKDKMAEHECFKDVNITRTTQLKKDAKQKYTLEFTVDCGDGKSSKKGSKKAASKKGGK